MNPMRPTDTSAVSQASCCGAKTRSGAPCKSAPVTGRRRSAAQTAAVHRDAAGTATTSMVDVPQRSLRRDGGYARPLIYFVT
jgi:hypothetical protein